MCSDFSAFHGIRDVTTELDGPTFFALAYRLDSYEGAVRAAAMREAEEEAQGPMPDQSMYPDHPPEYVERIRDFDEAQETYGVEATPPAEDAPVLTPEQLEVMFPAAPQIGQEVGMFEVTRCT